MSHWDSLPRSVNVWFCFSSLGGHTKSISSKNHIISNFNESVNRISEISALIIRHFICSVSFYLMGGELIHRG